MKLPELPKVNFYEQPSECYNFIHIKQGEKDYIRCAEYKFSRNHSDTFRLFQKEVAKAMKTEDYKHEFSLFFYNNYRVIGGGYVNIHGKDWIAYKQGDKTDCKIHGKSTVFGEADKGLVKRILEEECKYDIFEVE